MKRNQRSIIYSFCMLAALLTMLTACGGENKPVGEAGNNKDAAQIELISLILETKETAIQSSNTIKKDFLQSASRWHKVHLSKQLGVINGVVKGDTLVLNLFPDVSYMATVDRVSVNVQGTITIRGRLQNYPLGYVTISTSGGQSVVHIGVPELGSEYTVIYEPVSGGHYLLDIDPSKRDKLEESPVVIPPPPTPEEQEEIRTLQERLRLRLDDTTEDTATTLDVMVVYTPASKQWADSSGGGITNVIAQAMAKAQLVADNSGTNLMVRLVHSAEVAYTESGDSSTDLYRLQRTSDGYFDSVHTLRNTYGADLVVMLTKTDDAGGIGFLLNSSAGRPEYAFSITRVQQAGWTYTTIHEMGHNMGSSHHKGQNYQPGPGLFSYSAGWRWVSTDSRRYCSVMTYESGSYYSDGQSCTRVAVFSNPGLTYLGTSTGHTIDGDNARTVRETKNVVAAYRVASVSPPPPAAPPRPDGSYPLYRFWSAARSHHFFTISAEERDYIIATWPNVWSYEGVSYYAHNNAVAGTSPLYRFWSDTYQGHFFTSSEAERAYFLSMPYLWTYERIAYYVYNYQAPGSSAVYRFWSDLYKGYFYTISAAEKDYVIATWPNVWSYQGVAFYAMP